MSKGRCQLLLIRLNSSRHDARQRTERQPRPEVACEVNICRPVIGAQETFAGDTTSYSLEGRYPFTVRLGV